MHHNVYIVLCLCLATAGCASQPDSGPAAGTSPAPTAAAAVPTPAATLAANAAPASPPADGVGAAAATAELQTPPGYKRVEKDGITLFCRTVTPLGTRFPTKVCMTEDEYRDFEARNESMRQDMGRRQICVGAHCGEN